MLWICVRWGWFVSDENEHRRVYVNSCWTLLNNKFEYWVSDAESHTKITTIRHKLVSPRFTSPSSQPHEENLLEMTEINVKDGKMAQNKRNMKKTK